MSGRHFGIASNEEDRVDLWCSGRYYPNGVLHFTVINGNWDGKLSPDGVLTVKDRGSILKGRVLWEGEAHFRQHEYNEAIVWINEQLQKKEQADVQAPS